MTIATDLIAPLRGVVLGAGPALVTVRFLAEPKNWARLARVAMEEVEYLGPARIVAEIASYLPQQAFCRTRTALLRAAGVQVGPHSLVQGPLKITGHSQKPGRFLSIGANTMISGPLRADLGAAVRIGDWVRIGHDVTLLTIEHAIGDAFLRSGPTHAAPIVIGNGTWIASCVTILPGVTVGSGSVVAAGSVVTKDIPDNALAAGIPARVMRQLDDVDDRVEAPTSRRLRRWSGQSD
jgi:maltose O-acetyltransferase